MPVPTARGSCGYHHLLSPRVAQAHFSVFRVVPLNQQGLGFWPWLLLAPPSSPEFSDYKAERGSLDQAGLIEQPLSREAPDFETDIQPLQSLLLFGDRALVELVSSVCLLWSQDFLSSRSHLGCGNVTGGCHEVTPVPGKATMRYSLKQERTRRWSR